MPRDATAKHTMRRGPGKIIGSTKRNAFALSLNVSSVLLCCESFPVQRTVSNNRQHEHRVQGSEGGHSSVKKNWGRYPPFSFTTKRTFYPTLDCSFSAEGLGPDSSDYSNSDFISDGSDTQESEDFPSRRRCFNQPTNNKMNDPTNSSDERKDGIKLENIDNFDPEDWDPMDISNMDINELNDFFDSIEFPQYDDDDYVESEDAEELMQILQEMVDNADSSELDSQVTEKEEDEMDEDDSFEVLVISEGQGRMTNKGSVSRLRQKNEKTPHMKHNYDFESWNNYFSNQRESDSKITTEENPELGESLKNLERVLREGVVPAEAGVGSGILPGDYGFDPMEIATKDYFKRIQDFILNMIPERKNKIEQGEEDGKGIEGKGGAGGKENVQPEAGAAMPTVGFVSEKIRPPALILRDYREAEIRHGRLAMLAAFIWPLQEIFDRIFIPDTFGSTTVIYGGPTLPFFPLAMTFFMLNLGYLDIYSSEIKENESGDAFLPGECFWDPLAIMEGAPDTMKRNMQEREILNGRAAMIAVAAFIFEESMTHRPIITLAANELLFEPLYQVPFIQEWLDMQFGSVGSTILFPPEF